MKRIIKSLVMSCLVLALAAKLTWSVFTAQSQITASQFSTGIAQLYLFKDLTKGAQSDNLTHTLAGNNFAGIVPGRPATQSGRYY